MVQPPLIRKEGFVSPPLCSFVFIGLCLITAACNKPPGTEKGETTEVRIPRGAGGVGFLPLLVMEKYALIETASREAGIPNLQVKWIDLGGPAVMNDSLLSGAVDFIAAGPPAFLILWDRTRDSAKVKGVAAMSSLPMYLNTQGGSLEETGRRHGDRTKSRSRRSRCRYPSIIMQMYAREKYGAGEDFAVRQIHRNDDASGRRHRAAVRIRRDHCALHFPAFPSARTQRPAHPHHHDIGRSDGRLDDIHHAVHDDSVPRKESQGLRLRLKALDEAIDAILDDKEDAADILLASTGKAVSRTTRFSRS